MGASVLSEPIGLLLALLLSGQNVGEDSHYPLGKLGLPPVTDPATPLRLVDLEAGVTEEHSTRTAFGARLKLGARAFFGAEARDERVGAFFDTQRVELGFTEEDGRLDIEGSLRAPLFLVRVDVKRREDFWAFESDGSIRLSSDWEVLLSYANDTNDTGGGPPSLEEFIDTGRLPPLEPPTRPLRSGALGFLYQRENNFELKADARVSRVRTEAGFELTRQQFNSAAVWNRLPFELDGAIELARTGRPTRTEGRAEIGAAVQVGARLLATARTMQEWQPDVERSVRDYRVGLTLFGRRYRFARANAAAVKTLELARRVNELGYNERRVYDVDQLRAFRDRLAISPARRELADAINELYLAQVRERNVPQLGVELTHTTRELEGSTTRGYRAFVGVPWPLRWPFARDEALVEFVRIDVLVEDETFPSVGWTRRAYEVSASVELNREHLVLFRWTNPGQTPEELAVRIQRAHRFTVEYAYALGR